MNLLRINPGHTKSPSVEVASLHDDVALTALSTKADSISSKVEHTSIHEQPLLVSQQSNDDNNRIKSRLKRLPGWKRAALLASCCATASLIINIAAAVWLSLHPRRDGFSEIFRGSCDKAHSSGVWIHAAINAVSTALLSASNFCMQCLSAPTRNDVDLAHQEGKYLDIGVSGIRNLGSIAPRKVTLWWILGVSSLPLHLLYNSAFYVSLSTHNYDIYIAGNDFLSADSSEVRASINSSSIEEIQRNLDDFEQLNTLDCIKQYAQVFNTDRSNLVLVSPNISGDAVPGIHSYKFSDAINPGMRTYEPYDWICTSDPDIDNKIVVPYDSTDKSSTAPCDTYINRVENIADNWSPWDSNPEYCLSQKLEETCILGGNLSIIIVVILCNAVKAGVMLYVAFGISESPLLTIGDAIESFLQSPDVTTKGLCLLTRAQTRSGPKSHNMYLWPRDSGADESSVWTAYTQRHIWFRAASRKRWFSTVGLIVVALLIVGILLEIATKSVSATFTSPWTIGLGAVRPQAIFTGWGIDEIQSPSAQILAAILIANLPQTLLSFLYLNLNGLLTGIWLASEWSKFDRQRKSLRVSTPKGSQRGTHFLSLPYKIALPLNVVSGVLHWLVSQSLFLAVVSEWASDGQLINPTVIASCGFSPLAMLLVIILGSVIVVATLWMGTREFTTSMRLVGSCSAAISAACHRPSWDTDAHTKPVMWGVTRRARGWDEIGHCSFSSGEVEPIENGQEYS